MPEVISKGQCLAVRQVGEEKREANQEEGCQAEKDSERHKKEASMIIAGGAMNMGTVSDIADIRMTT